MEVKIEETSSNKTMKVIGTYVNSDVYEKLKIEADENFLSISSLIKKIIYIYLKNKDQTK